MDSKQIAELRKLRGQGMESAVGEYTPSEFWEALDEIERLTRRLAELQTVSTMGARDETLAWWRMSTLPECMPCVTACADEAQQWRTEGHDVLELVAASAMCVPQIDYDALIKAAYKRTGAAQGTRGCVQFAKGAEWFREQASRALNAQLSGRQTKARKE